MIIQLSVSNNRKYLLSVVSACKPLVVLVTDVYTKILTYIYINSISDANPLLATTTATTTTAITTAAAATCNY